MCHTLIPDQRQMVARFTGIPGMFFEHIITFLSSSFARRAGQQAVFQIGCVCLNPGDQSKSGFVKLKVDYTPSIVAQPVSSSKARHKLRGNDLELIDNYQKGTQRPCCEYTR